MVDRKKHEIFLTETLVLFIDDLLKEYVLELTFEC